jgi:hypothetical protein
MENPLIHEFLLPFAFGDSGGSGVRRTVGARRASKTAIGDARWAAPLAVTLQFLHAHDLALPGLVDPHAPPPFVRFGASVPNSLESPERRRDIPLPERLAVAALRLVFVTACTPALVTRRCPAGDISVKRSR